MTHVADIWMPFGQPVISAVNREALHVIDALCHHESDLDILEHYTDTAGYTYHVFALCRLLGFHFAPHIKGITGQLLYTPEKMTIPDPFQHLWRGRVNVKLIQENWDDARRLAGSVRHGVASAALIMRKLSAYPRQNRLARTLREIGKLERTLFVLDYLQNPSLRRRVRTGLNKGEALFSLARKLFFGNRGILHDRALQDQLHRASALMLLISAISCWNSVYLQEAYKRLEETGNPVPEEFKPHISPLGSNHINLLGRYYVDLKQTREIEDLRPLRIRKQ